jgi:hypothetical protein
MNIFYILKKIVFGIKLRDLFEISRAKFQISILIILNNFVHLSLFLIEISYKISYKIIFKLIFTLLLIFFNIGKVLNNSFSFWYYKIQKSNFNTVIKTPLNNFKKSILI